CEREPVQAERCDQGRSKRGAGDDLPEEVASAVVDLAENPLDFLAHGNLPRSVSGQVLAAVSDGPRTVSRPIRWGGRPEGGRACAGSTPSGTPPSIRLPS